MKARELHCLTAQDVERGSDKAHLDRGLRIAAAHVVGSVQAVPAVAVGFLNPSTFGAEVIVILAFSRPGDLLTRGSREGSLKGFALIRPS